MKLCKDCKYYSEHSLASWCEHEKCGTISNVTGHILHKRAVVARATDRLCGPDAKLFEEKPATIPFWKKLLGKK